MYYICICIKLYILYYMYYICICIIYTYVYNGIFSEYVEFCYNYKMLHILVEHINRNDI